VVPKTDSSGERVTEHNRVKHGDDVSKYAVTCGVKAATRARAGSAVKRSCLRQTEREEEPPRTHRSQRQGSSPV
jgi:hypothetical protein